MKKPGSNPEFFGVFKQMPRYTKEMESAAVGRGNGRTMKEGRSSKLSW